MSKAADLVKNLRSREEERPQTQSYWGRCECHGCPLQSSISAARKTCSYHFGLNGEQASAMTEAIKEKQQLLVKLADMQVWTTYDWRKKRPQIQGCQTLPLGESELPTMYLERFRKYVKEQIENRADDILIHGA